MKVVKLAVLVLVVFLLSVSPAAAQGPGTAVFAGKAIAAGLGMGLTLIGAGIGLGRIGSAAVEGMARQPEVAPRIQVAMIIVAAMLEGATLAAVVLSFVVGTNSPW